MFKLIQGFCKIIDIGIERTRGKLTICPTPIGNLQDWTPRQKNALFDIACEDTRDNIEQDDDDVQDIVFKNTQELGMQQKQIISFLLFFLRQLPELNKYLQIKKNQIFFSRSESNKSKKEYKEIKRDTQEHFEIYGITSPFITYLKNNIAQTKRIKGEVFYQVVTNLMKRRIDRILVIQLSNYKERIYRISIYQDVLLILPQIKDKILEQFINDLRQQQFQDILFDLYNYLVRYKIIEETQEIDQQQNKLSFLY